MELDELVSGTSWIGPIEGVFEYQHISWTPHLGYRDARSISIVTRYWGLGPMPEGFEIQGDHNLLWTSTCPNGAGSLGVVEYGVVETGERSFRTAGVIAAVGELNPAQTLLLEERFGPPVETPVSLISRVAAWFLILWQPVLLSIVVLAGSVWLVKRKSRRLAKVKPSR